MTFAIRRPFPLEWHFSHPFLPYFSFANESYIYMKLILHLVPVKDVIFSPLTVGIKLTFSGSCDSQRGAY